MTSDSNSIILDSFAGSGTTAHAVLNMNKSDGGNRKFILVEMRRLCRYNYCRACETSNKWLWRRKGTQ
ncbi:MAG: DNA methyltransferase [Lachnospira eligens]